MDEHDQYESLGLDESLEDERDLDQIMADRRAAEMELDDRDGVVLTNPTRKKLPQLLHDQGKDFFLMIILILKSFFFFFHFQITLFL